MKSAWVQAHPSTRRERLPDFTAEEDAIVRERYPQGGATACKPFLPGRTIGGIRQRASLLDVQFESYETNEWTAKENAVLAEHYPSGGPKACQGLLPNRSLTAIRARAKTLGLTVNRFFGSDVLAPQQMALLNRIAAGTSSGSLPRLAEEWKVSYAVLYNHVTRWRVANAPVLEIPEGENYFAQLGRDA